MNFKLNVCLLLLAMLVSSCLSSSDKQHACSCEYPAQTEDVIQGLRSYSDLQSGKECDEKCGFKRLLVLFYNESDASKKMLKLIESDQKLVNDINDNFAFVCLSTETSTKNLDVQMKKFKSDEQPFFAVLTSAKDSLITSFGYMDNAEKMDSILISTLH